jgi:hypothetical protein
VGVAAGDIAGIPRMVATNLSSKVNRGIHQSLDTYRNVNLLFELVKEQRKEAYCEWEYVLPISQLWRKLTHYVKHFPLTPQLPHVHSASVGLTKVSAKGVEANCLEPYSPDKKCNQ